MTRPIHESTPSANPRRSFHHTSPRRPFAWLLPVFLLAPFVLAPKGCDSAVVGDDCPAGSQGGKCQPNGADCGGLLGLACAKGQFCNYAIDAACGSFDRTGVCATIPDACDAVLDPVCGCDGQTYGNDCDAARAGVSVSRRGECPTPAGETCGTRGAAPCDEGYYCNFPSDANCGRADAPGVCAQIPQNCTQQGDPVCGCDGITYGNSCTAAAAGVSVDHAGRCENNPGGNRVCGGLLGVACAAGEYCNFPLEAQCGAADQTGVCTTLPDACDAVLDPVCGCDDQTYSSECEAARAGVSVASRGECATPVGGTACGARLGDTCGSGEYCNFPISALCGRADATGECAPMPKGCTREADPVCGCDRNTYGNPCSAAAAGVSVDHKGACVEPGTGSVCGGLRGSMCATGEYCNFAVDAMCGAADQTGVCSPIPDGCVTLFDPVCGCDDRTYSNSCVAAMAGVSVAHRGPCQ